MCNQNNETISHIESGCPKLAQKEYKKRHDNVARAVHWDLSEKYGFERSERWYDHVPDSILERTDHEIEARRPDLLIIDKSEKNCQIIDVAIPENGRVRTKEDEKVEKYQDLAREAGKMWGTRTKVIPTVVGALGTIPLTLKENLRTIGVDTSIELIQRSVLLESARIVRKVLEM